jgi:hypothetical protein
MVHAVQVSFSVFYDNKKLTKWKGPMTRSKKTSARLSLLVETHPAELISVSIIQFTRSGAKD